MYRFLIFVLIIHISNCSIVSKALCQSGKTSYCRPSTPQRYAPPHNYYHGFNRDTPTTPPVNPVKTANSFEDIAMNLISAEEALHNYCRENPDGNVKELYGKESYILKYTIPGITLKDLSVRIKHRLIYVSAEKPGLKSFKNLRILPNIVDTLQATYELDYDLLKVFLPYNVKYHEETSAICGNINDSTINVINMSTIQGKPREAMYKNQDTAKPESHSPSYDNFVTESTDTDSQTSDNTDVLDEAIAKIFESKTDADIDIRANEV